MTCTHIVSLSDVLEVGAVFEAIGLVQVSQVLPHIGIVNDHLLIALYRSIGEIKMSFFCDSKEINNIGRRYCTYLLSTYNNC